MSMESMSGDVQEALNLIREDQYLKTDPYALRVVEAGGVADNGEKVDIGDFLAARRAVLELNEAEGKVAAAKQRNPRAYDAAVISSVRPDLEN